MHQLFQSLPIVPPNLRLIFYTVAGVSLAILLLGTLDNVLLWLRGRDDMLGLVRASGPGQVLWMSLRRFFSAECLLARGTFARSRAR